MYDCTPQVSASIWAHKMKELIDDELTPKISMPADVIYKHLRTAYRGGDGIVF